MSQILLLCDKRLQLLDSVTHVAAVQPVAYYSPQYQFSQQLVGAAVTIILTKWFWGVK